MNIFMITGLSVTLALPVALTGSELTPQKEGLHFSDINYLVIDCSAELEVGSRLKSEEHVEILRKPCELVLTPGFYQNLIYRPRTKYERDRVFGQEILL